MLQCDTEENSQKSPTTFPFTLLNGAVEVSTGSSYPTGCIPADMLAGVTCMNSRSVSVPIPLGSGAGGKTLLEIDGSG